MARARERKTLVTVDLGVYGMMELDNILAALTKRRGTGPRWNISRVIRQAVANLAIEVLSDKQRAEIRKEWLEWCDGRVTGGESEVTS